MGRFCYCSKILPGKTDLVYEHWKNMPINAYTSEDNVKFWHHLSMTGFDSWLQPTSKGDFMIHCLEGESLEKIFKGLRAQISTGNPLAIKLKNFYENVLGKNYNDPSVEPHIELLQNISLPASFSTIKRAFCYPLLSHKEDEHRRFRTECMGAKRERQEAMMRSFGVSHLSTWLQHATEGKYIIVYTERKIETPLTSDARLAQGENTSAWHEIAEILMNHTGLKASELSPDVFWLTQLQTQDAGKAYH